MNKITRNKPKEEKDMYSENYKILMKAIKDNLNIWKYMPCSWVGRNQYCDNDHIMHSNLQIQCNPYEITSSIFHIIKKKTFKICMVTQKDPK